MIDLDAIVEAGKRATPRPWRIGECENTIGRGPQIEYLAKHGNEDAMHLLMRITKDEARELAAILNQ